jgi:hypothetical protein
MDNPRKTPVSPAGGVQVQLGIADDRRGRTVAAASRRLRSKCANGPRAIVTLGAVFAPTACAAFDFPSRRGERAVCYLGSSRAASPPCGTRHPREQQLMFGQAHSWWRRLIGREPRAGDDRRVWVRFPDNANAMVRTTSAVAPVQARVRDLSRGGIGLVVDRGFGGGNLLFVDLPPCAEHRGATVLAYVLRADPLPSGGWALGCTFAAESENGGSAALTGWLPDGDDRRAWARLSTRGSCRYYPVGGYALTRRADVVNVSPAGIGMVAGERIEPSTLLALELACPGGETVSAVASVVSVRPLDDGRWLMGCSLDREMDEDELRALWGTAGPNAD